MIKVNKHIEIVRSGSPRLSSMIRASADSILTVLTKHYTRVGITTIYDLSNLEDLVARRPDLVFLGMKFLPKPQTDGSQASDKIWLTDYLDEQNIPYTGSGRRAHELELNKHKAKQKVLDAGLKTSPFYVIDQKRPQITTSVSLTFPLFIKPTSLGAGLGIDSSSVAYSFDELDAKVQAISSNWQSDSLIEEYLDGREFSVSILKCELSDKYLVMPLELITSPDKQGARILSRKVKLLNIEAAVEVTDGVIKNGVADLAIKVFYALGARDYGRIDIRLDKTGEPQFLEANLLPSLIKGYGSFPKACVLNKNLGYEPMILSIVRLAMARDPKAPENVVRPARENNFALPSLESALELA